MSTLAEIEAAVDTLPRLQQVALLRHLVVRLGGEVPAAFSIATEADGLPVIRAQGGVITPALVREIEGLAGRSGCSVQPPPGDETGSLKGFGCLRGKIRMAANFDEPLTTPSS